MAKKKATPENEVQPENEIRDELEQETAPPEVEDLGVENNVDLEDEVEDITNSIITRLISEDELAQLSEELEGARKLAQENLDGWQRARAEFANYKRRIEREREEERARITGEIMIHYLGVIDDFERALRERPEDLDNTSWVEGIDLIYRKMKAILEADGVELIPAEGEKFDPNVHEAISQEESDDHDEGEILDVIQQGYKIGERVLRPALVRIAK